MLAVILNEARALSFTVCDRCAGIDSRVLFAALLVDVTVMRDDY
jgi:hypothetical protein